MTQPADISKDHNPMQKRSRDDENESSPRAASPSRTRGIRPLPVEAFQQLPPIFSSDHAVERPSCGLERARNNWAVFPPAPCVDMSGYKAKLPGQGGGIRKKRRKLMDIIDAALQITEQDREGRNLVSTAGNFDSTLADAELIDQQQVNSAQEHEKKMPRKHKDA